MKNKVLLSFLISLGVFTSAWAQVIPNNSFENWITSTNYLDLTLVTPNLLDTSVSPSPLNWTTSNAISNTTTFHHKTLVTQSSTAQTGASSIQLRSDSLNAVITGVPFVGTLNLNFVCPGFAICGNFPINFSAFVNLSAAFNPALLPGAGIPVSGRVAKIGGYVKYTPVGGDTAYVVAILRKGANVVATATYKHSSTDAGYVYFETPFVYQNCLEPDTLVYTLSSGNPYSISNVVTGAGSGLHVGSTLLADSIFAMDTVPGFAVAVPADDAANTFVNTAVTIPVTTNDVTCSAGTFVLSTGTSPAHGSVSISGTSIVYTPANNFLGVDTFTYGEHIGSGPVGTAQVIVTVTCGAATPVNDTAHTVKNTAVQIFVTANDPVTCPAGPTVITIGTAPRHGTATVSGDTILYTPNAGYTGLDTFTYTESIGGGASASAQVLVGIKFPAGINELTEGKTNIYPNPASNKLHILTSNPSVSEYRVYDMLGSVVKADNFSSETTVDVSGLNNGLYIIQFSSSEGKMISSTRFTLIK